MSSENKHIITRHNYEEFFLLYVDNELSASERKAVEAFAAVHPDLQEELNILMEATVLPSSSDSLGDKTFLMSASMQENTIDDSMLLYLDNELSGEEKKTFERSLQEQPEMMQQYQMLLKTKLPAEKMVFADKESLYRRTERRIAPVWMRVAAAVAIVIGLGLVFMNNGSENPPVVAAIKPVKTEQKLQPEQEQQLAAISEENNTAQTAGNAVSIQRGTVRSHNNENRINVNIPKQDITQQVPQELPQQSPIIARQEEDNKQAIDASVAQLENINTNAVTADQGRTYNIIDPPSASDHSVAENPKGGSTVKGFLRKATRFIEKRTGVNPVNEDDELLIGAVAIKLK